MDSIKGTASGAGGDGRAYAPPPLVLANGVAVSALEDDKGRGCQVVEVPSGRSSEMIPLMVQPGHPISAPCWNIYWLFFVAGFLFPPAFFCGTCGMRSETSHNARLAGAANFFMAVMSALASVILVLIYEKELRGH